jgi:hypothetical protein
MKMILNVILLNAILLNGILPNAEGYCVECHYFLCHSEDNYFNVSQLHTIHLNVTLLNVVAPSVQHR